MNTYAFFLIYVFLFLFIFRSNTIVYSEIPKNLCDEETSHLIIVGTPLLHIRRKGGGGGGGGTVFKTFAERWGSNFPHKKGEIAKIGACFKKVVSLIFILRNPFWCYLSLSVRRLCVFFVYLQNILSY